MSANYTYGVWWIARNDEPLDTDVESVASYISTLLLADLFGKKPSDVAFDIVSLRTARVSVRLAWALKKQGIDWRKYG
jgi:hypothetical protein